jgi:hypothetical protein
VTVSGRMFASALAVTLLIGTPAMATHHRSSCTKIDRAIASGKSADEVAKELKVPVARVNGCATRATKSQGTANHAEAK